MSVKPKGLPGNIKIAHVFVSSSASLKYVFKSLNIGLIYYFNPYIYILYYQSNLLDYLSPYPISYPYKMKYVNCKGGVGTARERNS